MAIVCFGLVIVGAGLIVIGAWISLEDWRGKRRDGVAVKPDSLEGTLTALQKLANAISGYPLGQQLIIWGIVVLIIAGLFGGIAQL